MIQLYKGHGRHTVYVRTLKDVVFFSHIPDSKWSNHKLTPESFRDNARNSTFYWRRRFQWRHLRKM